MQPCSAGLVIWEHDLDRSLVTRLVSKLQERSLTTALQEKSWQEQEPWVTCARTQGGREGGEADTVGTARASAKQGTHEAACDR